MFSFHLNEEAHLLYRLKIMFIFVKCEDMYSSHQVPLLQEFTRNETKAYRRVEAEWFSCSQNIYEYEIKRWIKCHFRSLVRVIYLARVSVDTKPTTV